jgi:hypothetical protein
MNVGEGRVKQKRVGERSVGDKERLGNESIARLIKCRNLLPCFRANHDGEIAGLGCFPVFPPIG